VPQEDTAYTSQKKRPKSARNQANKQDSTLEHWEINFNEASTTQTKFQVLLEALGHEDFPQAMRIPERPGRANFPEELNPFDPLWLWSKFVEPEVLETIAIHTNEYGSIQFAATEYHTRGERAWKDLTGADIGAYIGTAMLMGVHPQASIEDYWNCSEDKPIFPIQQYITRDRFQQITRYLKVNNPLDELTNSEYFMKLEPLLSRFRQACKA
jgi:hypothetical protein